MAIELDFAAVLSQWPLLLKGVGWTLGLTAVSAVLGVLLGTVVWVGALVLRKRGCVWALLPFPALVALWLVAASVPPDAEREFDRVFGEPSRSVVRDLETRKPIMMDGYLMSFRMSEADYARMTAGKFKWEPLGGLSFFGGCSRPETWPVKLETMDEFDRRDIGEDYVLVYFDRETQTVYAAFHYWGW